MFFVFLLGRAKAVEESLSKPDSGISWMGNAEVARANFGPPAAFFPAANVSYETFFDWIWRYLKVI